MRRRVANQGDLVDLGMIFILQPCDADSICGKILEGFTGRKQGSNRRKSLRAGDAYARDTAFPLRRGKGDNGVVRRVVHKIKWMDGFLDGWIIAPSKNPSIQLRLP